MDNQEIYEAAEMKYLEGVGIIRELCTIQKGTSDNSYYKQSLTRFETILQGVLLYVALENGVFMETEKDFVTGVTIFGNILLPLNSTGKRRLYRKWFPLTWDNINDTTVPFDRLQEIIKETIDYEVTAFVEPFAVLDRDISSMNYVERMRSLIPEIITAVTSCNTEGTEEERARALRKGIEVFDLTFCLQWEHFKKKRQKNYGGAEMN